ncbi:hypothetical protein MUP01_14680 [Candidatus Bathyarchaeota archaeon]|nr:hypothetical protein [Candidatus Bathyarchaeota archaeon]
MKLAEKDFAPDRRQFGSFRFGRRMGEYGKFFSEFLVGRSENAFRDLLRLGILPKIDGIYTPYLIVMTVLFENEAANQKVPLNEAVHYCKTTDIVPCNRVAYSKWLSWVFLMFYPKIGLHSSPLRYISAGVK